MWFRILLILLILLGGYYWWSNREISYGPGALAPDPPRQENVGDMEPFFKNDYKITPLASYEITARVLSRKNYSHGRESELSPTDLALGWGAMSDSEILKYIDISQSNRWYSWSTSHLPIPKRQIETSSANTHIIPGDEFVARELKMVHKGQVVYIKGYLVRVDSVKDSWHWKSSLTRKDVGDGACELVWAEELRILEPHELN